VERARVERARVEREWREKLQRPTRALRPRPGDGVHKKVDDYKFQYTYIYISLKCDSNPSGLAPQTAYISAAAPLHRGRAPLAAAAAAAAALAVALRAGGGGWAF
jgi:hypothetical protein